MEMHKIKDKEQRLALNNWASNDCNGSIIGSIYI